MFRNMMIKYVKRGAKKTIVHVCGNSFTGRIIETIISSYLKIKHKIANNCTVPYLFIPHLIGDTFLCLQLLGAFAAKYNIFPVPVLRRNCVGLTTYFPQIKDYLTIDEKSWFQQCLVGLVFEAPTLFDAYKPGRYVWIVKGIHPARAFSAPSNHLTAFAISLGVEEFLNSKLVPSVGNYQKRLAKSYFEKNNLVYDRTVVLAPYSNSQSAVARARVNIELFARIAELLKKYGWVVCTNVDTKNPNPIEGTIPVSPSLDILIPFCTFAGNVIAFRSGFCDVVAYSQARMFVLYPDDLCPFKANTYINYYSVKRMHDRQTWEYIIDFKNPEYVISQILEFFYEKK